MAIVQLSSGNYMRTQKSFRQHRQAPIGSRWTGMLCLDAAFAPSYILENSNAEVSW